MDYADLSDVEEVHGGFLAREVGGWPEWLSSLSVISTVCDVILCFDM